MRDASSERLSVSAPFLAVTGAAVEFQPHLAAKRWGAGPPFPERFPSNGPAWAGRKTELAQFQVVESPLLVATTSAQLSHLAFPTRIRYDAVGCKLQPMLGQGWNHKHHDVIFWPAWPCRRIRSHH